MTAPPPASPTKQLVLASQSPRRRELLAQHGFSFRVRPPALEDSELHSGEVHPGAWVSSLAYVKAAAVAREMADKAEEREGVTLLGADTIVVIDDRLIGKAADEDQARDMIRAMRSRLHRVVTGVAILDAHTGERRMLFDSASVTLGDISDENIDHYLGSGQWRGKAGAYNLTERVAAGWPIHVTGDPTTVVGLPMARLVPILESMSLPRTR